MKPAVTCPKRVTPSPSRLPAASQTIFRTAPGQSSRCHRTEIQNSTPVWLADKPEWKHCGLTYARLRFTTEAPAECADIFRAYQTGAPASGPFTRGLYYRGVD